jgi:hypothetical protein
MGNGGTRTLMRPAGKVLQLHPRETNRFAIERDGDTIKVVIECHSEYDAMMVYDQAIDQLKEGDLVLGVRTELLRGR